MLDECFMKNLHYCNVSIDGRKIKLFRCYGSVTLQNWIRGDNLKKQPEPHRQPILSAILAFTLFSAT